MLVIKKAKEGIKMVQDIQTRVGSLEWDSIQLELDKQGFAKLPVILTKEECEFLRGLYGKEEP